MSAVNVYSCQDTELLCCVIQPRDSARLLQSPADSRTIMLLRNGPVAKISNLQACVCLMLLQILVFYITVRDKLPTMINCKNNDFEQSLWFGCIWLMVETPGGLCWSRWWIFRFHKWRRITWLHHRLIFSFSVTVLHRAGFDALWMLFCVGQIIKISSVKESFLCL